MGGLTDDRHPITIKHGVHPKPYNLEAVASGTENYVHIQSHWSPTNVTAMEKCCAPDRVAEVGRTSGDAMELFRGNKRGARIR
ncbi:hypothetical protein PG996_013694 [Apiospora saccharicola]|uniref:Uncharacterized protein n=1 Tax=Apiospora saccharicola TaxID=335842 RepID=A0ABR1U8V7_9PEZI